MTICPRCHQAFSMDQEPECPHDLRDTLSIRRKYGINEEPGGLSSPLHLTPESPKEGTTMAHVDTETAKRLRRAAGHLERWHAERDELIRQAHAEGMGVREIARQVGMTHPGVLAILARDQDAEPAGV